MGALRFCGRVSIVLGLAVLALGVWLWLAGHDVTQPAAQLWAVLHAESQAAVVHRLHASLWRAASVLLDKPVWEALSILGLILLIPGGILVWVARRRDRRRSFR